MRKRRQFNPTQDESPATPDTNAPAYFVRLHSPEELDLDALAESIRALLSEGRPPRKKKLTRPKSHLLSLPDRGTHVLEARERS